MQNCFDMKKDRILSLGFAKISFAVLSLIFLFYFNPDAAGQNKAPQGVTTQDNSTPVYLDTNYTFQERAADLVSRMTLEEEVLQLHTNHAPAILRLGVHQYFYWNEAQHGINALFGNLNNGSNKREEAYGSPHATSFQ
jgi:hypothetical protein